MLFLWQEERLNSSIKNRNSVVLNAVLFLLSLALTIRTTSAVRTVTVTAVVVIHMYHDKEKAAVAVADRNNVQKVSLLLLFGFNMAAPLRLSETPSQADARAPGCLLSSSLTTLLRALLCRCASASAPN